MNLSRSKKVMADLVSVKISKLSLDHAIDTPSFYPLNQRNTAPPHSNPQESDACCANFDSLSYFSNALLWSILCSDLYAYAGIDDAMLGAWLNFSGILELRNTGIEMSRTLLTLTVDSQDAYTELGTFALKNFVVAQLEPEALVRVRS